MSTSRIKLVTCTASVIMSTSILGTSHGHEALFPSLLYNTCAKHMHTLTYSQFTRVKVYLKTTGPQFASCVLCWCMQPVSWTWYPFGVAMIHAASVTDTVCGHGALVCSQYCRHVLQPWCAWQAQPTQYICSPWPISSIPRCWPSFSYKYFIQHLSVAGIFISICQSAYGHLWPPKLYFMMSATLWPQTFYFLSK